MGGKASLASQVNRALLAIFRLDESRHAAKHRGVADRAIYSYATLRTYRQRCLTLLNSLPQDSRPRLLRDLTTAHLDAASHCSGHATSATPTSRPCWPLCASSSGGCASSAGPRCSPTI
jgi:hypothetical protein